MKTKDQRYYCFENKAGRLLGESLYTTKIGVTRSLDITLGMAGARDKIKEQGLHVVEVVIKKKEQLA